MSYYLFISRNLENTSFLSRLQDIDFFLNRVSEKSKKSRLRLKRDLDFFRDEIQKKSTPVGGSENDGNL